MNSRMFCSSILLALVMIVAASGYGQNENTEPQPPTTNPAAVGTETIVFLRHGEKPRHGLGQLTPQGLNRALALPGILLAKFGKPDLIYAPDPEKKVADGNVQFSYVRPLITIEPTAIQLEMPVKTPFGYLQIDKLNEELTSPEHANSVIFIAWEHGYEAMAAQNLVAQFGGRKSDVPGWPDADFDSLFVVKITRTANKPPTVTFTHDHEGLDGQSKAMPAAAVKGG